MPTEERALGAEVFIDNSMQYDHTIKRWEREWAGPGACGSSDASEPQRMGVRPSARIGGLIAMARDMHFTVHRLGLQASLWCRGLLTEYLGYAAQAPGHDGYLLRPGNCVPGRACAVRRDRSGLARRQEGI